MKRNDLCRIYSIELNDKKPKTARLKKESEVNDNPGSL